jgi:hypothetical protein
MSEAAVAEVERLAAAGGDADEVLRAVVAAVHDAGVPWIAVRFNEEGTLVDGPAAGTRPDETIAEPVSYNGERIGELEAAGVDEAFLERIAVLLAEYVLLGWDTGGETWEP